MKFKGKKFSGPLEEVIVFPRAATFEPARDSDGSIILDRDEKPKMIEVNNDLVFKCRAVQELAEFEEILPPPEPQEVIKPGGARYKDVENPSYKEAVMDWSRQRVNWMILKSLDATDGLEWENVNISDPETWNNFRTELAEGLNRVEVVTLLNAALRINSIDEAKMEEAKNRFLLSEAEKKKESSSLLEDPMSMPSGALAKDSV